MKTQFRVGFLSSGILASACLLLGSLSPMRCLADQPVITAIYPQRTNLLVEVSVPVGARRVTLESRPRFGQGTWSPLAVAQNDGSATTVRFQVACSRQTELMRVRADAWQPLPVSFYNGTNSFSAPAGSPLGASGPPDGTGVVGANGGGTPSSNGDPTRTVVESDIWQIDGNTLYFFNQYRGLQVIDITKPDKATVTGRLELPAAGEQMYLADSNHLVLLANGGCGYANDASRIIVVSVTNGVPVAITNLPIGGWVQDSRMVGTALYVASQNYRVQTNPTNTIWEWGTVVTSFDLANPEKPVVRGTLWYPGYGNVVSATDTYLLVCTQDPTDWWQSLVQIIDITSPDGTMLPAAQVRTAGRVPDKFKLNYTNEVLTTISEDWRWQSGSGPLTKLETFQLPAPPLLDPKAVQKLGELELGSGEQLHATRFDGNLVYVVTFFQIDPLWVVDVSDPSHPHVAGSVNVPGWSTYIAPLGPRLVTLGVESNRVAVSLFDVSDPAQPKVLSHLRLGQNYSWSDANYDEKAFTVLPEQGLVLVPYNGDTTNGWTMQVQLIDLSSSNLVARGIINHQSQPRRTAFSHDRILSLSGWELLSIDATDRDEPAVKGDLQLAWSVDRLLVAGDYLLELSGSSSWWGFQSAPAVRVTSLAQPDEILSETLLNGLPIVGASLRNGLLYVAQSQSYWYYGGPIYYGPIIPLGPSGGPGGGPETNVPNFFVTILDASHLPNLSVLGQTGIALDTPAWGGSWNALWPKENVLVWAGGSGYSGVAVPVGGGIAAGPTGIANGIFWPWWGSSGGLLLAFDVADHDAPRFDSEVNLATNGWWQFSQPFLTSTRVYLSHTQSGVLTNSSYPDGLWFQRSLLDVVDYADPLSPTVRPSVSIPGALQGIAQGGELLYTVGVHWGTNQLFDWTQWLDASAYDGVTAHLVSSLRLSDSWPHPVLVLDTNVFISDSGYSSTSTNLAPPQLQKWFLADSGNFTLSAKFQPALPVSGLADRNGLLIAQEEDSSLNLFDDSSSGFSLLGHAQPSGCLWFDLTQADGTPKQGLWAPLGAYGVRHIGLGP